MANLGPLDRTVSFQRPGDAPGGYGPGSGQGALAPIAHAQGLPASYMGAKGAEKFTDAQNVATQVSMFIIRWQPDLEPGSATGLKLSDTLVDEAGRAFDIKGITELGRREGLEIAGVAKV